MERHATVKVFRYLEELDAFLPTREYLAVAEALGLREWNPVVWVGRLFCMDNDFGEHWFDHWDLRDERAEAAKELGLDSSDLLIVDPDRFQDGKDGPCNPPQLRKRFWTEVLRSLELSYELLFDKARQTNERLREAFPPDVLEKVDYIPDLEERIARVKADPVERALLLAPADDEPETDDEDGGLTEARREQARDEGISTEELKRELDLG